MVKVSLFFTLAMVKVYMKVKISILICTGLMLNDHSNPYIESTTTEYESENFNFNLYRFNAKRP